VPVQVSCLYTRLAENSPSVTARVAPTWAVRVETLASAVPPSLPASLLLCRRLSTLPARPRIAGMATVGRSSQVVWWRREPADRRGIASTAAAWGSAMVKGRDRGGVG
jgi:hypothetical protein